MFEAAVIIVLFLWAGIIFLFTGFFTGLIFACLLISTTLLWLAFILVKIDGILAGAPVLIYSAAIIILAIFIKYLSDPSSIRRNISAIKAWADSRKRLRISQ